ncbi:MAG: pyridine nucleotide-disulfide oxidoreductase [Flavobacterium sp. MedPE-SWcel]|uniref:FAD-dependent oxidoreductase n=1 Tax=uncultured Flavobacterium sp. TaxID=165435 RepID=UPI00091AE66E|nr:FAD-dependent oxidoreductase [uncultured Flavobacterium sp.]OIQ17707.1 MAG: pyridine nucleotide-disulfide oxidoreductase [Flavobacterium sp. MedPE-SWcel]
MLDTLIIGGGVSGVSCALVLGSAKPKPYAEDKKIAIITHQKNTALQNAVFNNAYGIPQGKLGKELMTESLAHLTEVYPHVTQIANEKVMKVEGTTGNFTVTTNKNTYTTKVIVVAIGSASTFDIEGLNQYIIPHGKALSTKNRVELKNNDHLVTDGIYATGTLAGWRSQLAIASGSGAAVATDILTLWNNGIPSQHHDRIPKE